MTNGEISNFEVDHGHEIFHVPVSSPPSFYRLDNGVDALDDTAVDPLFYIVHDPLPMGLYGSHHFLHGLYVRGQYPFAPVFQEKLRLCRGFLLVESLEVFLHLIGFGKGPVLQLQLREARGPLVGKGFRILEPEVFAPFQESVVFRFQYPGFVDGIAEELGEMEFVVDDRGFRERVHYPGGKSGREIHAHFRDFLPVAPVLLDVLRDLLDAFLSFSLHDAGHLFRIEVDEDGNVVVSFLPGSLVDSSLGNAAVVGFFPAFIHVVPDDPHEPFVIFPHLLREFRQGHVFREFQDDSFEQEGEPASFPCPGEPDHPYLSFPIPELRHPGVEIGRILPEEEVFPCLPFRLLDADHVSVGIFEFRSFFEIEINVEPLPFDVQRELLYVPGGLESQCSQEHLFFHGYSMRG